MIAGLQPGARNAVEEVMQKSHHRLQLCVEKAASAGTSLTMITDSVPLTSVTQISVTQMNEMNLQIAAATEEQISAAEEINRNVMLISTLVEGSASGAGQTSASSIELTRLASQLQTLVGQFKI